LTTNAALTAFAASIVSVQVGVVPLHAPPQPAKTLLPVAVALNVTLLPLPRCAVQVPEVVPALFVQAMPPLVTLPEPAPLRLTVRAKALVGALRTKRTRLAKLRGSLYTAPLLKSTSQALAAVPASGVADQNSALGVFGK
jgi:hypothetical protein